MLILYAYSFLLVSSLVTKLSFSWECSDKCPYYLKCLVEEQAKEQEDDNKKRRLFQTSHDDASYLSDYKTQTPETRDMSAIRNNGLRGRHISRQEDSRQIQEMMYYQLKLYHELGYCWQSEWEDRLYCAECTNECEEWEELALQRCNSNETKQYFTYEPMPNGVGGRIKPMTNESLCWERTRVNAHQLKACDDINGVVNVTQIFRGFDWHDKFELHPFNRGINTTHPNGPMCLSCPHHPKRGEVIKAGACANVRGSARFTNTNFWTVYNTEMDDAITEGIANTIDSNTVNETVETEQETLLEEPVTVATDPTNVPVEVKNEMWSALRSSTNARVEDTSVVPTESP